ncbi:glycosyltransferase family 2 protein [Pseudodesulfovibrio sp.]|uniref:glycosyltransferase family 2 protein n=1 Tax=unclassified Pseudodesulfovibrio TaxID=2661612 RepID=UPI003B007D3B
MQREQYIPTERFEELDRVDLDTTFEILEIYCRTLLPDLEACLVFLLRILRDPDAEKHPKTATWLPRLVRKAAALGPLDRQALGLAHKLTGDPAIGNQLNRLEQFREDVTRMTIYGSGCSPKSLERNRRKMLPQLERQPGNVPIADLLLLLDFYQGVEHGAWLEKFSVPEFFREAWTRRLFLHLAGLGAAEPALALWPEIAQGPVCEVHLNFAAAQYALLGDRDNAIALYRHSLALDPDQGPITLRLAELENPTIPDASLTERHDVTIGIYSWNKADDLEMTLRRLAETNIGRARLRVLLNGCTDRSAEVCDAARALFPDNDFKVITLPVNVGAPAARNWLGSLPEVRNSEFLAYLDDDVELPNDWLAHYLSVMGRFPETSAVGCKIVHSHDPRRIQYLHRRFTLAQPGIIKLTDTNQVGQMDCGMYDYTCLTETVMGCCHLLRMAHMPEGPKFDLRYSPSQMDDIAHDLDLRLAGGEVRYCGLVRCIHHQNSGSFVARELTAAQYGQLMGNETKFYFIFKDRIEGIRECMKDARLA